MPVDAMAALGVAAQKGAAAVVGKVVDTICGNRIRAAMPKPDRLKDFSHNKKLNLSMIEWDAPPSGAYKISYGNDYVFVSNDRTGELGTSPHQAGVFKFQKIGDTEFSIRIHQRYVCADHDKRLRANRKCLGEWERFKVRSGHLDDGSLICTIECRHDEFCHVDVQRSISFCDRKHWKYEDKKYEPCIHIFHLHPVAQHWTPWEPSAAFLTDKLFEIAVVTGSGKQFLTCAPDGRDITTQAIGRAQFCIGRCPNGTFSFKVCGCDSSVRTPYLSADGGAAVLASRPGVREWEKFKIDVMAIEGHNQFRITCLRDQESWFVEDGSLRHRNRLETGYRFNKFVFQRKENWSFVELSGVFSMKRANEGDYITCGAKGRELVVTDEAEARALFRIDAVGNQFSSIKVIHCHGVTVKTPFLCADGGAKVLASRRGVGEWEKFVIQQKEGRYRIRCNRDNEHWYVGKSGKVRHRSTEASGLRFTEFQLN